MGDRRLVHGESDAVPGPPSDVLLGSPVGTAFCPRCGETLTRREDGGRERPACARCGFILYRNPVPVALALARNDGRFLLVRRANDPLRGFWAPPAGFVEIDETVEDAAVRETREETGLAVALESVRGVYSAPGLGILIVAYDGRVVGGTLARGDEVEDVGLFLPSELPGQPPTHPGSPLDRWFLSVVEELIGRTSDTGGSDEAIRKRIRQLEERLAVLEGEIDASRGEMASAEVEPASLREIARLSRELRELRGQLRPR